MKDGHGNSPPGLTADERADDGSEQRGYDNCGSPTKEKSSPGIGLVYPSKRNQSREDKEAKGEGQGQAAKFSDRIVNDAGIEIGKRENCEEYSQGGP